MLSVLPSSLPLKPFSEVPAITSDVQQNAALSLGFPCPNDDAQPNANHLNLPLGVPEWPIF